MEHQWRNDRLLGGYCKRCGLADTHKEARESACEQPSASKVGVPK